MPQKPATKSKKPIFILVALVVIAGVTAVVGTDKVIAIFSEIMASSLEDSGDPPVFVKLGRFIVPVIEGGSVTSQVAISITVEVASEDDADKVSDAKLRLRSAYIHDFSAMSVWPNPETGSRLPSNLVKLRLKAVSARILGPGIVRQVLISNVVERQLERLIR